MRLSALAIILATFTAAALACFVAAGFAVALIEDNSETGVRRALDEAGMHWAEVEAEGLQVRLIGTAPSEATRFKALSTAGAIVDAARVIDLMQVKDSAAIAPPRFSVEILRNDSGISIIGLVPAATNRAALLKTLTKLSGDTPVADFVESADYPVPEGWDQALAYALGALKTLPRSKISIDATHVAITAISDSPTAKRKLEADLAKSAPASLKLSLSISAPRPVITPFTLRFLIDADGARFDACSADTEAARSSILKAAAAAGLEGKAECTLGLGVPSPNWAAAVETAIAALHDLGAGSVTFSDADITLVAAEGTDQRLYDRTVGELENALPEVFALHSMLPVTPDTKTKGPPEFTATLSPEGLVQLRGRVRDDVARDTATAYARARFGSTAVYTAARTDDSLPDSWSVRVLTALEALSRLSNGAVTFTPDTFSISGNTGNPDTSADIARVLSEKLGETAQFSIDIDYQEKLDPIASLPTHDECEAQIAEILKTRKINFEPGSDEIDATAIDILDDIAAILKQCEGILMEISGHTDSQGREVMNQQLSQSRATAVLNELRARRVLTASFTAKGYGEDKPIADNDTEEGREANRRIEFRLIRPDPVPERETALEKLERSGAEGVIPEPTGEGETAPVDPALADHTGTDAQE